MRAAKIVCRDMGISDTTLWRWARSGWINLVNINGKNFIDMQELIKFQERAKRGEFKKNSTGAATKTS